MQDMQIKVIPEEAYVKSMQALELHLYPAHYVLLRLPAGTEMPGGCRGKFLAAVSSEIDLSLICEESSVPASPAACAIERGFRCLRVGGAFGLDSIGVIASVAEPLAKARVSLFLFSSWSTDHLLVRHSQLAAAIAALEQAGHAVKRE